MADEDGLQGDGWYTERGWGWNFYTGNTRWFCEKTREALVHELRQLARKATEAADALEQSFGAGPEAPLADQEVNPPLRPCQACGLTTGLELDGDVGIVCNQQRGGCGASGRFPGYFESEEDFERAAVKMWNEGRAEVERIAQYIQRRIKRRFQETPGFANVNVIQVGAFVREVELMVNAIRRGRHW